MKHLESVLTFHSSVLARYSDFKTIIVLFWGPLSLVRIIEELLE
jgi:hypothetical protein